MNNLPPIISGYSELIIRAVRAENRVERSGERELQINDGAERSGLRSGRSRSRNGAGSGGCRNRLELFRRSRPADMLCFVNWLSETFAV